MKKIILIVLMIISTYHSFAQTDNYRADLDYLFGALDKTKANTGYLAPYGIDAIDKADFNGILADSNTVNGLDLLRFIYADILTAKFNPLAVTLPSMETVNSNIAAANANTLVIFYANYNEFKEEAIQQGLIRYTNGRLYDVTSPINSIVNGRIIIPPTPDPTAYLTKKLLAVNPITPVYNNTVTLRYNPALFLNNTTATVQNVWINFGSGYTAMSANTDNNYTYTDSTGYHRVAIKVQMNNGDVLETYTTVMVKVNNVASLYSTANLANPDIVIPADATQSGCKVYIRRSVNTAGNQILKPLIVVEGLDTHDGAPGLDKTNYNVNDLIDEWNRNYFNNGNSVNYNFDDIGHYDLIFIDWNNGVDDIRRNAITLERVLNTVNGMKTGNQQNVVMGISMGGLVARYALASMTKRNVPTQTRLLVTHDSPHQGAYVPLALQHLVTGLQNKTILGIRIGGIFGAVDQGVSLLNSPAAQQQLIMTSADENGTVHQNTFLQSIYRPMIIFAPSDSLPQYQFIATSEGSQCGIGTLPVGGNLAVGEAQGSIGGPLFILTAGIMSKFRLKVAINASGLKADGLGSEILYFRFRRESSMFWGLVNTSKTFIELHRNEPTNIANPIPWESVPGGTIGFPANVSLSFSNNWNFLSLGFLGYDYRFTTASQFSFLPTISALDVANPGSINKNTIFGFQATPFTIAGTFIPQKIIAQEQFYGLGGQQFNKPHTDFTTRNSQWIFNEMQGITQPITCDDQCEPLAGSYQIQGPSVVCTTATFTVPNVPVNATVTWPVSGYYTVTPLNANASQISITINQPGVAYLTGYVGFPGGCFPNTGMVSMQLRMGAPTAYTYIPYFSTNGNTTYLQDVNHLITYDFPGMYSGDLNIVDQLSDQITWTKLSGWPNSNLTPSTDGKTAHIMIKPQCGFGIWRMTATNGCGNYSHDYKFIADNVTCLTAPNERDLQETAFKISLSPNPVVNSLVVSLISDDKEKQIQAIRISNKSGKVIQEIKYKAGSKMQIVNMQNLPVDIYVVEVFDGTQWVSQKIIRQ